VITSAELPKQPEIQKFERGKSLTHHHSYNHHAHLLFPGMWFGSDCLDGVKIVCMDKILDDIKIGKCLVYSFGLSMDWSFERTMAAIGCTIRAFDPTQDQPESITHKRINFHKIGLGHKNEKQKVASTFLASGVARAALATAFSGLL
jgi:hypothetical protein